MSVLPQQSSSFNTILVFLYRFRLFFVQFWWLFDVLKRSRNPRWPRFGNHDVITTSKGKNRVPNIHPEFCCQSPNTFGLMDDGKGGWAIEAERKCRSR